MYTKVLKGGLTSCIYQMAGLYIHIPFCRKACHYCNFHFSTSTGLLDPMIEAMVRELELRKTYLQDAPLETIYFGGGTPSLLPETSLNRIMEKIQELFRVEEGAELSFEVNPDDITADRLQSWKKAGINRLSVGLQSFHEEELRWMNRAHTAEQSMKSLELIKEAGFQQFSVDLIYGSPYLTDTAWAQSLDQIKEWSIPHLSCYALTVEPKTALAHQIAKSLSPDTDPEKQARQFLYLMDWAEANGYEHYEISNLSLPGGRSRHNTSYWKGIPYLGIGPSAHSFNGTHRQWNRANNRDYIKSLGEGRLPLESETLTPAQKLNEYIMTSLRTMEGIDLEVVRALGGEASTAQLLSESVPAKENGYLIETGGRLRLTKTGKLFADGIAADLFQL